MKKILILMIILLSGGCGFSQKTYKGLTGEQWLEKTYCGKGLNIAAKKLNYPPAQCRLASLYYSGFGLFRFKSKRKTLKWVEKSANGGHIPALYELGDIYHKGYLSKWNINKNDLLAETYLLKVIAQEGIKDRPEGLFHGDVWWTDDYIANSYYLLGEIYRDKNDYKQAVECYTKNISKNTSYNWYKDNSAYNLANIYEQGGYGIEKDLEKAYYYYSSISSKFHAGYGKEMPEDACKRLKPIVDKGKKQELDSIGNTLVNSKDTYKMIYLAKRYKKALEDNQKYFLWMKKAADLGNKEAYDEVGMCYQQGIGVTKNIDNAIYWYRKGAAVGYAYSKARLKELLPPNPSAKIENVWVEQDVTKNNQKGINIHVKFNTIDMKGLKGQCVVYFYNPDKSKMPYKLSDYKTTDGQTSCSRDFNPGYENSTYNDFVIFMPKSALTLKNVENTYYCDVYLWYNHKSLCNSEYYSFKASQSLIWNEVDYAHLPTNGTLPQTDLDLHYFNEEGHYCKICLRPPKTTYYNGFYNGSYTSPYYAHVYRAGDYANGLKYQMTTNNSIIFKKEEIVSASWAVQQNLATKILEISKDWKNVKYSVSYSITATLNHEYTYNIPVTQSFYDKFKKVQDQIINYLQSGYIPNTSTTNGNTSNNNSNSNSSVSSRQKCIICCGDGKCRGDQYRCLGTGKCSFCYGNGYKNNPYTGDQMQCTNCNGSGKCPFCNGTGRCSACNGTGYK